MVRCSEDLQERLGMLAEERTKYLAALANERSFVVDVDDEMDYGPQAGGVDR